MNFNYRVCRLGSDLSLTRDQEISNTFKIKKIEDSGYVFRCHPKTRFDFKQMSLIIDEAFKLGDKSSEVLPYAPCPTQITKSKHFKTITETNGYFLGLFANGFLDFVFEDVFKADTFEWDKLQIRYLNRRLPHEQPNSQKTTAFV
ncbi:hypothetical protein [Metabacillus idriensis]|uniref:hypothetical protein n=1 Tax=Metabacillus idriensis TaxID=324768 RepID=UPI00174C305C|nr:hypothetical protein [Metabacillus idriensis]